MISNAIGSPRANAATRDATFHDRYFRVLLFAVAAYALLGKGFAYFGVPPIFPAEVILAIGLTTLIYPTPSLAVLCSVPSVLLVLTMTWVILQTIPYIGTYGFDAFRDSVVAIYGLYALIVANLILEKPSRIDEAVRRTTWLVRIFPVVVVPIALMQISIEDRIPTWPMSGGPIIMIRSGEISVHLAGCAAFALLGLKRSSIGWAICLLAAIAFVATLSRGGLLSIVAGCCIAIALSGRVRIPLLISLVVLPTVALLYITNVEVPTSLDRNIEVRQIVDNVASIVTTSDDGNLDGTKEWRLRWWSTIVDYTIYGDYFWTGKGFGVNLAVSDGFVVGPEDAPALRSPHNGTLTFLARAGVPGLVLWICLNLSWFVMMAKTAFEARMSNEQQWSNLMIFVTAYLGAALVDSTFDVALEGPMIGVLYWVLFGSGIGLVLAYRELQVRRVRRMPSALPVGRAMREGRHRAGL